MEDNSQKAAKETKMITPLIVARRFLGTREVSRNQSPEIATFWPDTSYPDGMRNREPWCAAFVCHCLAQAAREGWQHQCKTLPREAAVREFLTWCKGRPGVHLFANGKDTPQPGDIVIFLPQLRHIGFIDHVERKTLYTVEGNTDGGGGRDGDGVYERQRSAAFPGWFARFL